MKKLFILTVLISAKLLAITSDEAHAQLMTAQKEHANKMAESRASEVHIAHLHRLAQQDPSKTRELTAAITAHDQLVDQCKLCVHGIQNTLKDVNHRGHFVTGDAFSGRVQNAPTASMVR